MFELLKQNERYIIGGYIKRGNETVLDIAVEAIDTPESIRKAMNTVRRTMTNYAPNVKPFTLDADQAQTTHVSADVAISTAGQAADVPEPATLPVSADSDPEPDPQPMPDPAPKPKTDGPIEGARGLLRLHCRECGNTFNTFLRDFQTELACKCGHHIDLTVPLARYHFTCPYCEKETWGKTNLEDPNITIRCKCGSNIDLWWVPKAKEYRN